MWLFALQLCLILLLRDTLLVFFVVVLFIFVVVFLHKSYSFVSFYFL